jgi:hypothetical protein
MIEIPPRGTREYEWWHKGALAEAEARREGRTKEGQQVLDCVATLTKIPSPGAVDSHERDGVDIGVWLVSVFSAPHTLRDRIRITRRIWKALR